MARGVRISDLMCMAVVRMRLDGVSHEKVHMYTGISKRSQKRIWSRFIRTGDPTVPKKPSQRGQNRALSTVEVLVCIYSGYSAGSGREVLPLDTHRPR
jgi:hypothetical protein